MISRTRDLVNEILKKMPPSLNLIRSIHPDIFEDSCKIFIDQIFTKLYDFSDSL